MQVLTRYGIVNSVRGRGGGFFFTEKNPDSVSLFDVINLFEGEK